MKKKIITLILCISMVFSFCLFSRNKVYADPFTAAQIASTAYAMMQSWGVAFNAGSASASGMSNFMTGQVEDYVNASGGSIADVFVGQIAVDVAGKLVVGQTMYNSVIGFLDWLKDKFGLSDSDTTLTDGEYEGEFIPYQGKGGTAITGTGIEVKVQYEYANHPGYYQWVGVYNNGVAIGSSSQPSGGAFDGSFTAYFNGTNIVVSVNRWWDWRPASPFTFTISIGSGGLNNSLSWSVSNDWTMPTVLNPDQEWTGLIGGYSQPDTNLDQLLGNIDQAVADNNLVVDGEVIDVPIPTPTPAPIDPDTPLSDVPWEGLDNNMQDLINQGLEEIGTIGEAKDEIIDAVTDQTAVLEGAIEDSAGVISGAIDQAVSDVNSAIGTQSGVISGAIDQAVSDIQEAIGEQTAALDESLSATAEGVETIVEAIEDEEINWRTFNLRGLFPFCIPFDIYNLLHVLDASPTAPHVYIPFVIQSIGFSHLIELDFSAFDSVASIMRQMELICYAIALAWATSKVIKW